MLINFEELKQELNKALDSFQSELKKIRTGKASAEAIGNVQVEAYGTTSPLNSLAQVQVEDAMNVKINVWDRGVLQEVEKALREANLGGSVVMDKESIRIKFNPMTSEDREAIVKELNSKMEDFRVWVRRVRQDFMQSLKELEGVSEDDVKRDEDQIQKHIDEAIEKIDSIGDKKSSEILKL